MAWTDAEDVVAAWIGDDAPDDLEKVAVWVDKAERMLRVRIPSLQDRLDDSLEPDLLGNIEDVVTAMVQRVFRNPEGVRQRQEGSGPFSGSVTYGGDQPGALWVTDSELAMLAPVGAVQGAFTIDLIPSTSPFSPSYVNPLNEWEIA